MSDAQRVEEGITCFWYLLAWFRTEESRSKHWFILIGRETVAQSEEALAVTSTRIDILGSDQGGKLSIPMESLSWYRTCLLNMKHWLVHRMAIASHCSGQIRISSAFPTSRRNRIRDVSRKAGNYHRLLSFILYVNWLPTTSGHTTTYYCW